MANVFLTCFATFKPFSFSDELAISLFSSLSMDLQRLQKSLEHKPPSLGWCSEAMMMIKKIHSHFLCYLERSEVPPSWEGVEVLDEYMRSSLDLLDLCNLLRLALSGLHRYQMMVDVMVSRLEDSGFSIEATKIEIQRLERGMKSNRFTKGYKFSEEEMSKVKMKTSMNVLQTIRSTMSVMSFLIMRSTLNPTPTEINEGFYIGLPGLESVSGCIEKLVSSYRRWSQEEGNKGGLILYERKMIEDAFHSFKEGAATVERVEKVRKRCAALKQGLEVFQGVMDELFEDVIKGRKRVIHFINRNKHTA